MVKLILPNSAPPGQESQKCLENKCTALVTSRLREVMKSDREVTKDPSFPRGDQSCALIFETFLALLARVAELEKMSFAIQFVYENYNF